jgi:hypothetical protein
MREPNKKEKDYAQYVLTYLKQLLIKGYEKRIDVPVGILGIEIDNLIQTIEKEGQPLVID